MFPNDLEEEINQFDKLIIWKKVEGTDTEIPEPQKGIDKNFDSANETVNSIKADLNRYLEVIRTKMNNKRIGWSHAKYRYEIEIPVELVKGNKKPKDFEFTSQRKGFERFHTKTIKDILEKLENAEENLKEAMIPFLCAIFSKFY